MKSTGLENRTERIFRFDRSVLFMPVESILESPIVFEVRVLAFEVRCFQGETDAE